MELIKISAICLIACIPIILLKEHRSELAFLCALAAAVVILISLVTNISAALNQLSLLCGKNEQIQYYFKVALKALGIAYLTGFTADLCRDFGQSSLASKAELGGKGTIFILALPLLKSLLELALKVAFSP